MNIQGAFSNFPQSIGDYCATTKQAALSVVFRFKELRNDPDFFQKVGQIAFASLQLIMMNNPSTAHLARLSSVVYAVGMHDFYRVIQYPRHWFFPVSAEVIDEFAALEDLTDYLAAEFLSSSEEAFDEESSSEISEEDYNALHAIAKECLEDQLTLMGKNNDAYRSLDEFIGQLQKQLRALNNKDYDLSEVDLSGLDEKNPNYNVAGWIRPTPTLEKITNCNWAVVDVLTVAWWSKEWNLLDTAKHAETIGQYTAFQWVKNQHLEQWLIGLVCTAFAWKLLESVRKLRDEKLTAEETRQARWNVITSVAECAFFGSLFTNLIGHTQINNAYVQLLAISAKSLGLISIATRPSHQFFQRPEAAAPAA